MTLTELDDLAAKVTPEQWQATDDPNDGCCWGAHVETVARDPDHPFLRAQKIADVEDRLHADYIASLSPPVVRALIAAARALKDSQDLFIHMAEYWNRSQNDRAMSDALYHMIEVAEEGKGGTDAALQQLREAGISLTEET